MNSALYFLLILTFLIAMIYPLLKREWQDTPLGRLGLDIVATAIGILIFGVVVMAIIIYVKTNYH